MKKLILFLALALVMCGCTKHIENTFRVGTVEDDCEYLKSGTTLEHKYNCKYCAERRNKEQERKNKKN